MKKTIWIIVVVAIIIIVISISTGSNNSSDKTIKIGVIDVLSDQYASLGENFLKGIELRKEEYGDLDISLIVEDDAFNAQKGLSAYKKLMEIDKVDALIVATSPTINVIYPEVSKVSIPVLTYGSQGEEEKDDNVFHVFPSSVPVVKALGELIKATSSPSQVVSVYTNDPTVLKFYNAFKEGFGSSVKEFSINNDSKDFRTIATKVLAENPEHIFISAFANAGAQFVKELLNLSNKSLDSRNIKLVFDLTFTEATSEYEKVIGNLNILDGSTVVSIKQADKSEFESKYLSKYNEKPGQLADYGYDAFKILLDAYSEDSSLWIKNIKSTDLVGATGEIKFDNVGRRIPIFKIGILEDGKIPEYK